MGELKKWKLNESVTGVIEVMLEELITRKHKLEKLEKAKTWWSLLVMFCLAVFLFFGYEHFMKGSTYGANFLSILFENQLLLLLIVVLAIGLSQVRYFEKKAKKAEKEFDALREEFIDRSSELWDGDEDWTNRQNVFTMMEKEFEINLFYK
ncbi:DUF2663 family protein [Halalkalibacter urbisdiaboli]|uniref:DUF2663 family protein n=1 Tax=Halalkalibacter urbisdiaboli TaxID=1960589 RepID=UPI000B4442A7|nr:DUF2663 family protein [Halalkalibacter urbisdiaboli]